jgi:hypothetical protein
MERKQSFQSGRVWLNVFGTEDGQSIVTINKSFIRDGEWKSSPFFNVDRGDIEDIKQVLEQYEESTKEVVVQ